MGRASAMASGPPHSDERGSSQPIENSPPGIQTIPAGALPEGLDLFSTVGRNAQRFAATGLEFDWVVSQNATANEPTAKSAINPNHTMEGSGAGSGLLIS